MLREGAQRLLAQTVRAEFEEFLPRFAAERDEGGRGSDSEGALENAGTGQTNVQFNSSSTGGAIESLSDARDQAKEASLFIVLERISIKW